MITVNMSKARDLWRDKIRAAREPLLATLDVLYQRTLEAGFDASDVVARKQALRDVTADPAIDAAQTLDELKAVWPAILTQNISDFPTRSVPAQISDRQFFQQAAADGLMTQAEALAAVATGAIPAILQTIVDGITDPAQNFAARMLLSGATVFDRSHPLTAAVGAHLGWTSAQIDQFFIRAAAL